MKTYLTEYNIIKTYYGDQVAKRSQVPLINHIDEGIVILKSINASDDTIAAYCLHPILQSDDAVCNNIPLLNGYTNIRRIILTMEYRRVANNYLSKRTITSLDDIELSPMLEVNQMLWADKLQNQKDFRLYHLGKHDRSDILEQYFIDWINKLEPVIKRKLKRGTKIELTPEDQNAIIEMSEKICEQKRQYFQDNFKRDKLTDLHTMNLNGFGAELAFCRLVNAEFDFSTDETENHFLNPDCTLADGKTIDVKTTIYPGGKLIVRTGKEDAHVDAYALMIGTFPSYTFRGWATYEEIIRDVNLQDLGYGDNYALEQGELESILVY